MMMMMICMIDKRTHMSSVAMIFILQNYVQEMREVGFLAFLKSFTAAAKSLLVLSNAVQGE
jgi:hypothetical protein